MQPFLIAKPNNLIYIKGFQNLFSSPLKKFVSSVISNYPDRKFWLFKSKNVDYSMLFMHSRRLAICYSFYLQPLAFRPIVLLWTLVLGNIWKGKTLPVHSRRCSALVFNRDWKIMFCICKYYHRLVWHGGNKDIISVVFV